MALGALRAGREGSTRCLVIHTFSSTHPPAQLEPKDLSEQLKKSGAAIPSVRSSASAPPPV